MDLGNIAKDRINNLFYKNMRNILTAVFTNRNRLLVPGLLSMVLLFVLHSAVITPILREPIIQNIIIIMTIILLFFVEMSVVWAGALPTGISVLGLVLVFTGITLPFYGLHIPEEGNFKGIKIQITQESIVQAADAYFFLGISMSCLSLIIAFRPNLLYTRNRPESIDSMWDGYRIWGRGQNTGRESTNSSPNSDHATQFVEEVIPIKILMNEEEKCLLWRYEYVLAIIHNDEYLVGINAVVPAGSVIVRDSGGRMMGKSKYPGYFV